MSNFFLTLVSVFSVVSNWPIWRTNYANWEGTVILLAGWWATNFTIEIPTFVGSLSNAMGFLAQFQLLGVPSLDRVVQRLPTPWSLHNLVLSIVVHNIIPLLLLLRMCEWCLKIKIRPHLLIQGTKSFCFVVFCRIFPFLCAFCPSGWLVKYVNTSKKWGRIFFQIILL